MTARLQVYNAYHHGFATLRALPPVASMQQNAELVSLLRRLVDEHCEPGPSPGLQAAPCPRPALHARCLRPCPPAFRWFYDPL